MATSKATTKKPATPKPAEKPAAQPAKAEVEVKAGLTLKDLAEKVGKDPKAVRRQIRKIKGGPQVGQGGRYHWESEKDPEFVELLSALTAK